MFRELFKIFSQNLYLTKIVLLMRISSWNFVRVPKGTRSKFQLEILSINVISGIAYFRELIFESSQNVSETIPSCSVSHICIKLMLGQWCRCQGWCSIWGDCWWGRQDMNTNKINDADRIYPIFLVYFITKWCICTGTCGEFNTYFGMCHLKQQYHNIVSFYKLLWKKVLHKHCVFTDTAILSC